MIEDAGLHAVVSFVQLPATTVETRPSGVPPTQVGPPNRFRSLVVAAGCLNQPAHRCQFARSESSEGERGIGATCRLRYLPDGPTTNSQDVFPLHRRIRNGLVIVVEREGANLAV